ncbi:MAG: ADP-ribosylglycohydrolase family protein [Micavibrio aeruginosavorus]|nr:ADP-ribosylglycohydrolase family protein [Micavibrio aeruginosavorus]
MQHEEGEGEIFPLNTARRGRAVRLGEHYAATLQQMGHDPAALPPGLFFTFCGDILGSSGEHYARGTLIDFAAVLRRASLNFSDDFMESLAMHVMERPPTDVNLPLLMQHRDLFHDLIRDHFQAMSLTYSPWFGALFAAKTTVQFADILQKHSSCGAAMRAAILAGQATDDAAILPYFLITHAHLEAIEGAYAVLGLARAAMAGQPFDKALEGAAAAARTGRRLCQNFQRGQGWEVQDFPPLMPYIHKVLETGNAYAPIHDIAAEGIETRFVVPAAFLCVRRGLESGDPEAGVAALVTSGLEIGGDPDTICSIALGLYGLFNPDATSEALAGLVIGGD